MKDYAREYGGYLSTCHQFGSTDIQGSSTHFDEILQEADGIILSRGNSGIDLSLEKMFLFQKSILYKCNMSGKPAVLTRVVDVDNMSGHRNSGLCSKIGLTEIFI